MLRMFVQVAASRINLATATFLIAFAALSSSQSLAEQPRLFSGCLWTVALGSGGSHALLGLENSLSCTPSLGHRPRTSLAESQVGSEVLQPKRR